MKRDLDWLRRQVDLVAIARPHLEGLKFEAGEHKALCPFHKEKTPSFTLYVDNGVQRYKCFGCSAGGDVFDFLMAAEQLTRLEAIERVEELAGTASAPPPEPKAKAEKRGPWKDPDYGRIVATYDYTDAAGRLLYQVLRVQPGRNGRDKEFPQRTPDGKGGFVYGLQGQANVLYRWPALLRASEVWVCEGEKDVHTLEAAGRVATTNSGGAAQWQKPRPDLADVLKGKTVYVVPDNDSNGEKRGKAIIADLRTRAARLFLVKLPEFVKDVTEFIESGQSVEDMVAMAVEVPTERPEPEPPPQEPPGEYEDRGEVPPRFDWRTELLKNRDQSYRPVLANAILALRLAPEWHRVLWFDEFALQVISRRPFPGVDIANDLPWSDRHDALFCNWLQHEGIYTSVEIAGRAVQTVARERSFHPVRDFLTGLKWDGEVRIDDWLVRYLGAEPTLFNHAVGRRWLISAVARIMEPGCKADCCLVLEGRQGLRKSTALEVLGGKWYTNQISELGTKDSKQEVHGAWIIEIAELGSIKKADVDTVKDFMSSRCDRFRAPYAKHVMKADRQCVFAGSVNHSQYLRDETGARRFWPVECTSINIDQLAKDRDQLWAEAVVRYQEGCNWFLDSEELERKAEEQQEQRREVDPWHVTVERHCLSHSEIEVEDILLQAIEKRKQDWTQADRNRVVRILRTLGYEVRRPREGEKRVRRYVLSEDKRRTDGWMGQITRTQ